MTQEELNNLIEQKYKEIEELESQKEQLFDANLEEIGNKMLKQKYYAVAYRGNMYTMVVSINSYVVDSMLSFKCTTSDIELYSSTETLTYHNYTFIPITGAQYRVMKKRFKEYHDLEKSIKITFEEIKNKS